MSDAPVPAAPKSGMNPILKWLLIGCGTLVLLSILVVGGCSYFVYHKAKEGIAKVQAEAAAKGVKLDTSHGVQGFATSMTTAGVMGMQPMVLMALPKDEQPGAQKAFQDLNAKGGLLTTQDMDDLGKAMDAYSRANHDYQAAHQTPFDPDAARNFVKAIQGIADRH